MLIVLQCLYPAVQLVCFKKKKRILEIINFLCLTYKCHGQNQLVLWSPLGITSGKPYHDKYKVGWGGEGGHLAMSSKYSGDVCSAVSLLRSICVS